MLRVRERTKCQQIPPHFVECQISRPNGVYSNGQGRLIRVLTLVGVGLWRSPIQIVWASRCAEVSALRCVALAILRILYNFEKLYNRLRKISTILSRAFFSDVFSTNVWELDRRIAIAIDDRRHFNGSSQGRNEIRRRKTLFRKWSYGYHRHHVSVSKKCGWTCPRCRIDHRTVKYQNVRLYHQSNTVG